MSVLSLALQLAGLFPLLLGLFVLWHLLQPARPPADTSNRINRMRLLWFALTRPDLFVGVFPWLARDELDNVGAAVKSASDDAAGRIP